MLTRMARVNKISNLAAIDMIDLENLDKNELIELIKNLNVKYCQNIKEFGHLKSQLEINEIVLDTQKKMVEEALKEIHELSITDPLTRLYNRRFFNDIFNKELSRAIREQNYITLSIFDIDSFKLYNDTYGHQKGDEALMKIGALLKDTLKRPSDYAFRLGGEEFGLLFCHIGPNESYAFCEEIRKGIEALALEHSFNSASSFLSASFGLVSIKPSPETTLKLLYNKADEALYSSKKSGKNRTTIANI